MADIDERRALIGKLFGAANKTCDEARMEGYLEALKRMDTPRLFRAVESILAGIEDMADAEDYKPPTAGGIWKALKKLRALPAAPDLKLQADEPKFLPFDTNANHLLMAYLWAAHGAKNAARYAPDCTLDANCRAAPGPITHVRTAVLVRWKDLWAAEMRADRAKGGTLDGKQLWAEHMACAEDEIDRLIASEKAAA